MLVKKIKQNYDKKLIKSNWNSITDIWKRIKPFPFLNNAISNVTRELYLADFVDITNPYNVTNTFNNYFPCIAETSRKIIKHSHKHISECLKNNAKVQN